MGREAIAEVFYADRSGRAKVLLESDALILRAPIAARIARPDLKAARVEGEELIVEGPAGKLRLALGGVEAGRWLKALQTPPPTLAAKLGVKPGLLVWTHGDLSDSVLVEALAGSVATDPGSAVLGVARASNTSTLETVLSSPPPSPLWIIHGKGKGVFGDNDVRSLMRNAGWIDSKACAVSAGLSATLYRRRP